MRNAGVGKGAKSPFRACSVAPVVRKTVATARDYLRAVIFQRRTSAPPPASNLVSSRDEGSVVREPI